jgi:hypothetical protein
MADERRLSVNLPEDTHADLAFIAECSRRRTTTGAVEFAVWFTKRYFERRDSARARGREFRLEAVEVASDDPETVLRRTEIETQ